MSTFTIPFPEYDIANLIQTHLPKKENFSVAIPLSRQQKFYDLLVIHGTNKKSVTIQVKSSRTWPGSREGDFQFYSWLNRFDIKDNYSDFYFIYMTYPILDTHLHPGAKWERKILVFNRKEMTHILNNIKTKNGKKDRFFSFGLDVHNNKIYGARGFQHLKLQEFSKNLFENRISELRKSFKLAA